MHLSLLFRQESSDEITKREADKRKTNRLDRHFRTAARMSGRIYMPLRTSQTPSCTGLHASHLFLCVRLCVCVCVCVCMCVCQTGNRILQRYSLSLSLVVVIEAEALAGTSDNIVVDKGEFRQVLNEAVRIARSFDDGLAPLASSFHHILYINMSYRRNIYHMV